MAALLYEFSPNGLRVCSGRVFLNEPLILMDHRDAHAAYYATQQTLSDDTHHNGVVELKAAKYTELRP